MIDRMDKINELLKEEVSKELLIYIPGDIVSITEVNTSKDLSYARIWIRSLKNTKEAISIANHYRKEIQANIAKKIELRKTPKLSFVEETAGKDSDRIEELLKEIQDDIS